jgi:hypothetical protein
MKKDKKRINSTIREDLLEALDNAFPHDTIELWYSSEESYLDEVCEELRANLSQFETADLDYERDWQGVEPGFEDMQGVLPIWFEEGDLDEDEPIPEDPLEDICYSYHLFFLGLKEEKFRYECENEIIDEEDVREKVEGTGTIGCAVGLSLLAPFAVIMPGSMETYEYGPSTYPDIDPCIFDLDSNPIDMTEHFREIMGEDAVQALAQLRTQIISILESFDIALLPDEEAEKPVPWLQVAEDVMIPKEATDEEITLKDALFFRCFY